MSEADDLQRRAKQFADDTIRFIRGLPQTQIAQRIAGQLLDSVTSVAANSGPRGGDVLRTQQLGLIILLGVLILYVIWRTR